MKALILTADQFEDSELLVSYYRLREEGITVQIGAPAPGLLRGEHGYKVEATRALREVKPGDYDLLIVPGGQAPDVLSEDKTALRVVEWFFEQRKPIAAICHGPLVLAATGLMAERQATGHPSIAFALRAAGVHYVDREVVVDDDLVTSREPEDLPAFMRELMTIVHRLQQIYSA